MIADTKTVAPNLPEDVKIWMDQDYGSLAEGIASQRVNAFSLIFDDGSTVAAAFVANQPVGQQTFLPMGIGWVSHKGRRPFLRDEYALQSSWRHTRCRSVSSSRRTSRTG